MTFIYDEDAERYPYAPHPLPIEIPEAFVLDDPQVAWCFSQAWIPAVLGALETLLQKDAWVGSSEEQQLAVDQVEILMSGLCNCHDFITGIRIDIDTNALQIMFAGDETWTNIDNYHNSTSNYISPQPDMSAFDNPRCTLSTFVREELETGLGNWLNIADAASDVVDAITNLLVVFEPWGPVLDLVADAITAVYDAGINIVQAWLTTEHYDEMQCLLHCALDEENPVVTDEIYETWLDSIFALGGIEPPVITLLMRAAGKSFWQYVFWRAQFAENVSNCGFCSECEEPEALLEAIPGLQATAGLMEWSEWGPQYQKYHLEFTLRNEPWNQLLGFYTKTTDRRFGIAGESNRNFNWQRLMLYPNPYPSEVGAVQKSGFGDATIDPNTLWCWFMIVTNNYNPSPSMTDVILKLEPE